MTHPTQCTCICLQLLCHGTNSPYNHQSKVFGHLDLINNDPNLQSIQFSLIKQKNYQEFYCFCLILYTKLLNIHTRFVANTQKDPASCLGRGFVPADEALISCKVVQFGQFGAQTVTLMVTFVGQENSRNRPPIAQCDLTRHEKHANNEAGGFFYFYFFSNYRRFETMFNNFYSSTVWFLDLYMFS